MNAQSIPKDDVDAELEQLVAQVRGRNAEEVLPRPSPEALAALVAHLRDEEPMSVDELAEHERLWRAVEEEMRAVEWANDKQERLL
jgi:predicted transcriptional regulator